MPVFRSRVEELVPTKELDFDPTPGFGKYRKYFPDEAVKHPAKANTNLLEYLVENYTEPGDLVLDPMAGTGSTCVVAVLHGRNAVCVDIEEKFCEWMVKAKEIVEKTKTLTPKGRMVVLKGDARRLSELLMKHKPEIDAIITSPSYSGTSLGGGDVEKRMKRLVEKGYNPKDYLGGRARNTVLQHYSNNPENIGNLPYGEVDAIITSPPYADAKKGRADVEKMAERWERHRNEKWNTWGTSAHTPGRLRSFEALGSGYSDNPDNIGNLPYGNVDTIITSPPYAKSLEGTSRHTRGGIASRDPKLAQTGTYALLGNGNIISKGNIGNLEYGEIDAIITSPSYSESMSKRRKGYTVIPQLEKTRQMPMYTRDDNIANLKKETYIEAMLRVYRECWKVLKPGGRILVIIKPFIRNKKVVDLPYHTMLMLEKTGFRVVEALKYRLKQQSFWRILYYKKFPEVPRIEHEYVLVGVKT